MNYTLKCLSLEHRALVKIAITLWNQDDIRALMSKIHCEDRLLRYLNVKQKRARAFERRTKWQEIEFKVIKKVPQLSLPESLKEEILCFIKPVGLQILKWKECHHEKLNLFSKILPSELCWTPQGTVDFKKTAEALIKDESLNVISRYKLACTYCLEDDVLELWNKIPENRRKSFYCDEDPIKVRQQDLVVLWMYNIKEEVNKLDDSEERDFWREERSRCSPYQYAFQYAGAAGNKPATEYFLEKLTSSEREESFVKTAERVASSYHLTEHSHLIALSKADVLCFLLSQMDEEQQIEVFKRDPIRVLNCLLEWPCQSLFMETANRMWDFLSVKNYDSLLFNIVCKVREGHKDYDYQKLFREFWQQSPNAHKRYVIDGCISSGFLLSGGILLPRLFHFNDKENVKLILKDATLLEKRKIIFSDRGQGICASLICEDEWDLLQFFIRECISSKEEMIKFKEEFEGRLTWCTKEVFAEKKDKFFQMLDDFIN